MEKYCKQTGISFSVELGPTQVVGYPCVPKMSSDQLRRLEREMAARLSTIFDEPEEDQNDFEGVYEGLADINKASRIKVGEKGWVESSHIQKRIQKPKLKTHDIKFLDKGDQGAARTKLFLK